MTPELAIVRAERARLLIEDQFFQDAMKTLEAEIVEAWSRCPIRDIEGQQKLLLMLQTAKKFQAIFEHAIASGEVAKNDLNPPSLRNTLERFVHF